MSKFETILKTLDSTEEYILKTDVYDPIIAILNEQENLHLLTKDLLGNLLKIYSFKLKYYFLDHRELAYKLENNNLSDSEIISLLKELIDYERRHL